jgi:hypothetical protein
MTCSQTPHFFLIIFDKKFDDNEKRYNFAAPKVKQAAFTDVLKY